MGCSISSVGGGMRELLETITNSGKNISDDALANWKNKYPFLLLEFVNNGSNRFLYSSIVSSEQFYNYFNGSQSYFRFYGTNETYNWILYKDRNGLFVANGSPSTLKIYGMIL